MTARFCVKGEVQYFAEFADLLDNRPVKKVDKHVTDLINIVRQGAFNMWQKICDQDFQVSRE